jgi:hypothetical protein
MDRAVRRSVFVVLLVLGLVSVVGAKFGGMSTPAGFVAPPAGRFRASAVGPIIIAVSPRNGETTGNATPVISVIYASGSPVAGVDFHLDGMNLTSAGMFNQTAFVLPLAMGLRNGPHIANFTALGLAGGVGFANWTFTVDTIPPILLVTAPVYTMVSTSLVLVQGTALLASPLFSGAAPINVTATVLPSHAVGWTFAGLNGSFSIPIPLSEGVNTVFVNATDRVGNLASQIKSLVSDTVRPPLLVLSPANGSVSGTNYVQVSGVTEPGVFLTVNGFSVAVFPNGTWSVNLDLPDGLNILQVAAVDQVGNLNYTWIGIFVDSDLPQITLTSPTSTLTNQSQVLVAGTVRDTMVVALLVNGLPVSFNASGGFSTMLTLPEGTDPIVVVAADAAHHTTILRTVITVDTTPPVVTVVNPPDGLETNQSSVLLRGSVDDPKATILVDNQVIRPDASGQWQTTVALLPGLNTISVSAFDPAGNRAAAVLVHVTYFSPLPDLENRLSANQQDLDNLGALVRFSLVGISLLAVGIEFELYARTSRKIQETRGLIVALIRAQKRKP